ncbi:hypothetical protein NKI65_18160 [Mesorhizobium sp. M0578]
MIWIIFQIPTPVWTLTLTWAAMRVTGGPSHGCRFICRPTDSLIVINDLPGGRATIRDDEYQSRWSTGDTVLSRKTGDRADADPHAFLLWNVQNC